ncbi:uncharacterized protein [Onthophagus taurus]|uniref:uncharacterized protein n=1 Tax=Onthophagus taurus TaxID=166361 RepID=UPI0039BE3157
MYSPEEEIRLLNMRRSWHQGRRSSSTFSLLGHEEEPELFPEKSVHNSFDLSVNNYAEKTSEFPPILNQLEELEAPDFEECVNENEVTTILDASKLGDIPAKYVIQHLAQHQFPVAGVYVDQRILPGFKYSVLPLCNNTQKTKPLFNGKALTLKSIGRGYARRFTFEDGVIPNIKERCFWSDNNPGGYAFELKAVSVGDKFTIYDANHEPQGFLEVTNVNEKQLEIDGGINKKGIEKKVKVKMTVTVELYDDISQSLPITGVAVYAKKFNEKCAKVTKVLNVNIKNHRYYLIPGVKKNSRWIKVNGSEINDVPTKYTIKGIEQHELPAVGTYVDPRILPGFVYKVRPINSKRTLFNGQPLKLTSIGQGYAKRFTFESNSKLENDNFFWSDNNLEGYAFETRAVYDQTRFNIICNDRIIGEARVFRSDLPQLEHETNRILVENGKTVFVKHVHVNLLCHVKLDIKNSGSVDESLMKVYGLAILRKSGEDRVAKLEKIDNVALDSQINLLFAHANAQLTFVPIA